MPETQHTPRPKPHRCSRPLAGHAHDLTGGCADCRIDDAAVRLRTAAQDFAGSHPVEDDRDTAGQRRNRRLLDAAVAYTEACYPDRAPTLAAENARLREALALALECVDERDIPVGDGKTSWNNIGAIIRAALETRD